MLTTGAINKDIETRLNYIQCCLGKEVASLTNKLAIGTSCEKDWLWTQFATAALETFKDYRLPNYELVADNNRGCYTTTSITLPPCAIIGENLDYIYTLPSGQVTSVVLIAGEFTFEWVPTNPFNCSAIQDFADAFNTVFQDNGVYMTTSYGPLTRPIFTFTIYPESGYSEQDIIDLVASMSLTVNYSWVDGDEFPTDSIVGTVNPTQLNFCEGWDTDPVLQQYNTCNILIEDFEKLIQFLNQKCKECLPQYSAPLEDCNCIIQDNLGDLLTDDEFNIEY